VILGLFLVNDLEQLGRVVKITVSQCCPGIGSVYDVDVIRLVDGPFVSAGLADVVIPYPM
jgi:hypothetical protein